MAIDPKYAEAHRSYGLVLALTQSYGQTIAQLRKAIQLNANDARKRTMILGISCLPERQADDAAVEYRQAIRLEPQLADAHCSLGNLLGAQEKFEEAKSELRVCVQLAPDNYEAHLGLGMILMREGKTAEARAQCQKAVESPDPSLRNAAQRALEQLGR